MSSVTALLHRLLAINSANPATCPVGNGEDEIATFCVDWLTAEGIEARKVFANEGPTRPCVMARAAGVGGGRSLLLCAHLDTFTWFPPGPATDGGILKGAGALDMKGGIALILAVLKRLAKERHSGEVAAVLLCDEEHRSAGARSLAPVLCADGAIVVEGTGLKLVTSHRGRIRATITARSHAERDEILFRLFCRYRRGDPPPRLELAYAIPTTAVPVLVLQESIHPGEDVRKAWYQLCHALNLGPELMIQVDLRESFRTPPEAEIVGVLSNQVARHGLDSVAVAQAGWTEASILAAAGLPCVVFGPGGGGAHTDAEWVDLGQLDAAESILFDTAMAFCA